MPACPVGIPVCCGGNVASGMASLVHSSYGNNRLLQSMFLVLAPSSVLSCLATLRTSGPIRSEYFMVAPAEVTHDNFFAKSKQGQADLAPLPLGRGTQTGNHLLTNISASLLRRHQS